MGNKPWETMSPSIIENKVQQQWGKHTHQWRQNTWLSSALTGLYNLLPFCCNSFSMPFHDSPGSFINPFSCQLPNNFIASLGLWFRSFFCCCQISNPFSEVTQRWITAGGPCLVLRAYPLPLGRLFRASGYLLPSAVPTQEVHADPPCYVPVSPDHALS